MVASGVRSPFLLSAVSQYSAVRRPGQTRRVRHPHPILGATFSAATSNIPPAKKAKPIRTSASAAITGESECPVETASPNISNPATKQHPNAKTAATRSNDFMLSTLCCKVSLSSGYTTEGHIIDVQKLNLPAGMLLRKWPAIRLECRGAALPLRSQMVASRTAATDIYC
jgi:hypothetical protein